MNLLIMLGFGMIAYVVVAAIVDPDLPDPDEYIWDEE